MMKAAVTAEPAGMERFQGKWRQIAEKMMLISYSRLIAALSLFSTVRCCVTDAATRSS